MREREAQLTVMLLRGYSARQAVQRSSVYLRYQKSATLADCLPRSTLIRRHALLTVYCHFASFKL